MKLTHDLTGNKAKLLEICYWGIAQAEKELIDRAVYINLDIDKTADVPQSIQKIKIENSSIFISLEVNGKNCSDDGQM